MRRQDEEKKRGLDEEFARAVLKREQYKTLTSAELRKFYNDFVFTIRESTAGDEENRQVAKRVAGKLIRNHPEIKEGAGR